MGSSSKHRLAIDLMQSIYIYELLPTELQEIFGNITMQLLGKEKTCIARMETPSNERG
jgi:hypothetical protein